VSGQGPSQVPAAQAAQDEDLDPGDVRMDLKTWYPLAHDNSKEEYGYFVVKM
jgi:hypothetical protein